MNLGLTLWIADQEITRNRALSRHRPHREFCLPEKRSTITIRQRNPFYRGMQVMLVALLLIGGPGGLAAATSTAAPPAGV